MKYDTFSIQKYVGVTPQQLANLQTVLTSERMREYGHMPCSYYYAYAAIKTVSWDTTHESLTVEVVVWDYARQYRKDHCDSNNERRPTERWVIDHILNALERFKNE